MAISISIDNLDSDAMERLRAEAQRRGVDVSTAASELLKERLGLLTAAGTAPPYRDLKALAGTWSKEEAGAFLAAIADFERVDEDMWK